MAPPPLPTATHLLGLVILAATLTLAWRTRKSNPALAFGVLWIPLALAPVSNVVVATGIVLAERTLYLPSVGLVLVLSAVVQSAWPRFAPAPATLRGGAIGLALVLLLLGAIGSVRRQAAWVSQEKFFAQAVRDAPRTYRAHFIASRYYYGERRFPEAETAARSALALYAGDPQVHEQLGQVLRVEGRCGEALPVLESGLRLDPARTTLRSRLIECALAVGDTARARAVAEEAVRLEQPEFQATLTRLSR